MSTVPAATMSFTDICKVPEIVDSGPRSYIEAPGACRGSGVLPSCSVEPDSTFRRGPERHDPAHASVSVGETLRQIARAPLSRRIETSTQ